VQLTAGAELKAKLERACDLMRHRNPSGDLAAVVDAALELLLAKLERERLGKVKTPRTPERSCPRTSRTHAVPVAVRREVFERDGEQCTYVSSEGARARCPSRGHLELDHIEPRALGGPNAASNLRVRCRAHNRLHADHVFGRRHVEEQVDFRQRKSPPILELALRGLQSMGFAKTEARRALEDVSERRAATGEALEAPDLLRDAIAALTSASKAGSIRM
jgi:5-methylcytosine-specific restriction endonuclease McrA